MHARIHLSLSLSLSLSLYLSIYLYIYIYTHVCIITYREIFIYGGLNLGGPTRLRSRSVAAEFASLRMFGDVVFQTTTSKPLTRISFGCVYIYIYIYIYIYTCIYIYIYTYIHDIYIYIYMYTYLYIYVCSAKSPHLRLWKVNTLSVSKPHILKPPHP